MKGTHEFKQRKLNRIKELTESIKAYASELHSKPIVTMVKIGVLVNELKRVIAFKEGTFPKGGIDL